MGIKSTTLTTFQNGVQISSVVLTWTQSIEQDNSDTIIAAAQQALVNNRAFIALPSPTNAQVTAQITALSRQTNGIIRLLLGALDGTN